MQVGEVYRCRWEIEVDNAVEKEGARLDEITATKGVSIRILLLASMLNATIARTIVQSEKVDIRRGKAPSEPADRAPLNAILVLKALTAWHSWIVQLLFDLNASRTDWSRLMSRLRSMGRDINWRRRPSVLDRILGLTAPPVPKRSKGVRMASG